MSSRRAAHALLRYRETQDQAIARDVALLRQARFTAVAVNDQRVERCERSPIGWSCATVTIVRDLQAIETGFKLFPPVDPADCQRTDACSHLAHVGVEAGRALVDTS